MIHISSKIHGIEVGGVRHPMQTVHYQDDQFTDEELADFMGSEFLTVEQDTVDVASSEPVTAAEVLDKNPAKKRVKEANNAA